MKNILILLIATVLTIGCKNDKANSNENNHNHSDVTKQNTEITKKKVLSPHTETMAMIGDAHVHIDYSSPSVRGRIIFGGLVGYDNVWQAGAHNATWIETNKDLKINNDVLPAGKYGLFMIPSREDWTIIFNRNWEQHGKDEYDEKDDVLRFNLTPIVSEEIKESLEYNIKKIDDNNGEIVFAWEKVTIKFPFSLN